MTFTNTDTKQIVRSFNRLTVNDQIAVLASIYSDVQGSASSQMSSAAGAKSSKVEHLVKHISEMREGNQVQFLQDVLTEKANKSDETTLDPHPSKALLELLPGGKSPMDEYHSLSDNDRLDFWFLMAQKVGKNIPTSTTGISEQATELINSMKSIDFNQKLEFLKAIF